jgi:hypothetical protein
LQNLGVAIEVVEAVVEALLGKLSPNAVNAPSVPAEVLEELQPYISLAEGLGRAAVSLVSESWVLFYKKGRVVGGGLTESCCACPSCSALSEASRT